MLLIISFRLPLLTFNIDDSFNMEKPMRHYALTHADARPMIKCQQLIFFHGRCQDVSRELAAKDFPTMPIDDMMPRCNIDAMGGGALAAYRLPGPREGREQLAICYRERARHATIRRATLTCMKASLRTLLLQLIASHLAR